jgi:competence protein ComEC
MALAMPMPNAAWQVGRVSAGAADWLATVAGWAARIPGASLELRPVPAGWVLLAYTAMVLFAMRRRVPLGRVAAGVAAGGLAALTVWTQLPAAAPDSAELHLLAVGGGQCAVLRTPGGRTLLLDAGTRSGYDVWEATLAPFLRKLSLPAPGAAFVSHANSDHYNALPPLLCRGDVRTLYLNEYFGRGGTEERPEGPEIAQFLGLAEGAGAKIVRLTPGASVWLDDRTSVEILWPPPGRSDLAADANDTSLVLRVHCDGRTALVTGDIGAAAQRELTAEMNIAADVLVLPHHGSWEKTLPDFVEAVDPIVIVVSAGSEPRAPMDESRAAGQRRRFLQRLWTAHRYYSTAHNGWCRIRFGRDGLDVQTAR